MSDPICLQDQWCKHWCHLPFVSESASAVFSAGRPKWKARCLNVVVTFSHHSCVFRWRSLRFWFRCWKFLRAAVSFASCIFTFPLVELGLVSLFSWSCVMKVIYWVFLSLSQLNFWRWSQTFMPKFPLCSVGILAGECWIKCTGVIFFSLASVFIPFCPSCAAACCVKWVQVMTSLVSPPITWQLWLNWSPDWFLSYWPSATGRG